MQHERSAWWHVICFALVSLMVLPSCGLVKVVKNPEGGPIVEPVLSEPTNLDFESVDASGRPVGWQANGPVGAFGVDEAVKTSGERAAWVEAGPHRGAITTKDPTEVPGLFQCVEARPYRDKTFTVQADLKTAEIPVRGSHDKGLLLLWWLHTPEQPQVSRHRQWSDSTEWGPGPGWEWLPGTTVATDALWICFGFGPASGGGKVWADRFSVKVGQ